MKKRAFNKQRGTNQHIGKTQCSRLSLSCIAALMIGVAPSVTAQEQQDEEMRQEAVIITGSLIPQYGNLVDTSPVSSVGVGDFEVRGVLRVEDLLNNMPQIFGAQGSRLANGGSGTATINLRGLGSDRTLTLLNGRRLPMGAVPTTAPDVNNIPQILLKRVDILTGGSSATYGSDALSGVVNFVLDDKFEGVKATANYSFNQHNNNNSSIQTLLQEFADGNPSQYKVPSGSVTDGHAFDFAGAFGGQFDGGKGHITGFVSYQANEAVIQDSRDFSQCALSTRNGGTEFNCGGSSTNQFANLLLLVNPEREYNSFFDRTNTYEDTPENIAANKTGIKRTTGARTDIENGLFAVRDGSVPDTFNYNPYNHFTRPNQRWSAGTFFNYSLIEETMDLYGQLLAVDSRTNSQIAPSGVFGGGVGPSGGVNCDNPFLSDAQRDYICGTPGETYTYTAEEPQLDANGEPVKDADGKTVTVGVEKTQTGLAADAIAPFLILRRNVEGGNRNQDIRFTTMQGVLGLKGVIPTTSQIEYDISAMYANVHRASIYNNDLSKSRYRKALYAVEGPDGNPVCKVNADDDPTNDDAGCVPYDIFSPAGPSAEAIAYINSPLHRDDNINQTVINGRVFGSLEEFDIKSPMAQDALAFAVGYEFRRDHLDSRPDANFQADDGAGQGGPTLPISGSTQTNDVFLELNVPLVQANPFIEQLGIDFAWRLSQYRDSGTANAFKVGFDYAPLEDIRFRFTYQRAVRAPNVLELFAEQQIGLFDLTLGDNELYDPCAGAAPDRTLEECARTGAGQGLYGGISDNPAGQFNSFTGGNPDLNPETGDTFTVGMVLTPTMLPDFALSFDFFDISVNDYIDTLSESLILTKCLDTGDAYYCGLINRGDGGTLWANDTGYIKAVQMNTGALRTRGFDISARYDYDIGEYGGIDYGSLSFGYVSTILLLLETKPLQDSGADEIYNCVGYYGSSCGSPNPVYRHKADLTWKSPWDVDLNMSWRFYQTVDIASSSSQTALAGSYAEVEKTFPNMNYLDITATYHVNDEISLKLGINNISDETPPISSSVGTAPGNANTYPQIYDALGRYIFLSAKAKF